MEHTPGRWIRLTPDNIAAVPNADGVFEIANLVRSVQYVGRACGRLRDTLAEVGHMPRMLPASVGGYFFRFELTTAETETFQRRIEVYRKRHHGALPPGNRSQVVELVEPVRIAPAEPADEAQQAA
ncbi:MAG TPA: hypothetical protein VNO26_16605 [Candidatus Limnocylindria bacterium]|nr:hypothetical protein [Candidatus Limnocylindria bacterium]